VLLSSLTTHFDSFACAIPELVATEVVKFSTYTREFEADSDLFDNVRVWEVCRATAAASTFFDPIKLGPNGVPFLDGATGANNPIKELWTEAGKAFGDDFESRVQCVVSIGTGESGHVAWGKTAIGIVKALKEMATYTENAWRDFRANHKDLKNADRLYRFNVVRGLEKVGLEDAKSRATIQQMTTFYMGSEDMVDTLKRFKSISNTWQEEPEPSKYLLGTSEWETELTPTKAKHFLYNHHRHGPPSPKDSSILEEIRSM
jgi:patatin-like phospholipase